MEEREVGGGGGICQVLSTRVNIFCFPSTGVSVQVSIFTLTVVAGDRCFAIVYPLQSRVVKSSSAVVVLAVCIVWTIAIGLNIPLIFLTQYIPFVWSDGVSQV